MSESKKINLNPLAEELNDQISNQAPAIFQLLSEQGKRIYYPVKGIIAQAAEAKEMADPKYNATVGIATDSQGPLSFPAVNKYFNSSLLHPKEVFDYSPTYGQASLRKLWKEHIQEVNPNLKGKDISLPIVGGGLTHCISVTGEMFFDPGDTLLLPDQIWGNYRLSLNTLHGATIRQFAFLNDTGFNLSAFQETLEDEARKGEIRLILNFPNNPTGYTPTQKEADEITQILVDIAHSGTKVLVILDEAYFGLFFEEDVQKESLFGRLCDAHENLVAVKICGATKEFFVWGFRVGFITIGFKGGKEVYPALEKKIGGMVRATVSNCSSSAQSILSKVLSDKSYLSDFKKNFEILRERANHIKEILSGGKYNDGFIVYPFNSGYFMLIKVKEVEAEILRRALLEREKIGTIATGKHDLRIAFSCLELPDIDHVFEKIYHTIIILKK